MSENNGVSFPGMDTKEEAKAVQAKVELVMSMCGRDPGMKLAVLSYALVFTSLEAEVTFASLIKNLADIYDVQYQQGEEE